MRTDSIVLTKSLPQVWRTHLCSNQQRCSSADPVCVCSNRDRQLPHANKRNEGVEWGYRRSGRHAVARGFGAMCVQKFDDSRKSAIHTTYRISLRSSSLREPRHPLLRVISVIILSLFFFLTKRGDKKSKLHTRSYIGCVWEGEDAHFKGV